MTRATVLIPTHDNGETIRWALASAQRQTEPDLEIFVIGDGTTDATREIVADARTGDNRIRFFDFPKGPRHGELNRARVLHDATGQIVCYLADDDLWLPDHVATMASLLEDADFAHSLAIFFRGDGEFGTWILDLTVEADRTYIVQSRNRIPLSSQGHIRSPRTDAFRSGGARLPRASQPTGTCGANSSNKVGCGRLAERGPRHCTSPTRIGVRIPANARSMPLLSGMDEWYLAPSTSWHVCA